MNSTISISVCVSLKNFLIIISRLRLSFSLEAKHIIKKVLKGRPTVLNLSTEISSGPDCAVLVKNIVKVRSSASSVIGKSHC